MKAALSADVIAARFIWLMIWPYPIAVVFIHPSPMSVVRAYWMGLFVLPPSIFMIIFPYSFKAEVPRVASSRAIVGAQVIFKFSLVVRPDT